MTFSPKLAVIALKHKKEECYRPISLTNTDYKMITLIFARRLQTFISKQIGNEQTAYVKGRYICMNARFILNIF